jgi:hypothetical protein
VTRHVLSKISRRPALSTPRAPAARLALKLESTKLTPRSAATAERRLKALSERADRPFVL